MVELLATRNSAALGALMRQHLLNKRDAVIELMHGGGLAQATWATAMPSTTPSSTLSATLSTSAPSISPFSSQAPA
jgi:hypothetical protein